MASADEPETIAHVALTREHSNRRSFWLEVLEAAARARPALTGLAVPALTGLAVPARADSALMAIRSALEELPEPLRLTYCFAPAGTDANAIETAPSAAKANPRIVTSPLE